MFNVELTDEAWKFWSREPFPPPSVDYKVGMYFGTFWEPDSSRWCASLVEPVRNRVDKPFTVLDWGCGDGRLFDFLAKRFADFKYFGLEHPGPFGDECVRKATSTFEKDSRAEFGVYDTILEARAVSLADFVILGSVATHIPFPDFESIVVRLIPVMEHGGAVVSSFFIGDTYSLNGNPDCYGYQGCYHNVWYTMEQIGGLCRRLGLTVRERETCFTSGFLHRILLFEKGSRV